MSQSVDGDGKKTGITENDFILAGGGRIAVIGSLDIGLNQRPDFGDLVEEGKAYPVFTTKEELDYAVEVIAGMIELLRKFTRRK